MEELSLRGASSQDKTPVQDADGDFEPTADMLVHDFDDEQTLEEEEKLQGETNFSAEIDDLTREGEIPIHELLRMYGYGGGESAEEDDEGAEEHEVSETNQRSTVQAKAKVTPERESCDQEDTDSSSDEAAPCSRTHSTAQLLYSESCSYFDGNNGDESEDEDYVPSEDWKKEVKVGPMYQAETPAGLCKYEDDERVYENEDQLLWKPELLPENEVVEYLSEASKHTGEETSVEKSPVKPLIKDNEQALYELIKCNFNKEEALSRLKFETKPAKEELPLWTEEEHQDFEQGNETCERVNNSEERFMQIKLWRRTSSLHPGTTGRMLSEVDSTKVVTNTESSTSSSQLENEKSITTHKDGSSSSTEQLLFCVSDHRAGHSNGSSHGLDLPTTNTNLHSSSRLDTSSPSREPVSRLVRQREDEEVLEKPLKRPKTEVDLLLTTAVSGSRMEAV